MSHTHPPYPPEFQTKVARLPEYGDHAILALGTDLGALSAALRSWLRRADADAGQGQPGDLTTDEREERRRELKILWQERAILRKAAACFVQETF